MFGSIFKKSGATKEKRAPSGRASQSAPEQTFQPDRTFPAQVFYTLLGTLLKHGQFIGAAESMKPVEVHMTPEGIQIALSRENLASVFIAEKIAIGSFVSLDAKLIALISIDGVLDSVFGRTANWNTSEGGRTLTGRFEIPGSDVYWEFVCKNEPVDPFGLDSPLPGATMEIRLRVDPGLDKLHS